MKRNTSHNVFSPGRLATVLPLLLLAGCVSQPQKLQQRAPADPTPGTTVTRNVQPVSPDEYARTPEVVRYDRYLLVSTDPQAAQRDPLSQIIDIRIPSSLHPTVADALRYALRQSGYSLCATGSANGVLYRQALPAVQYQLGPMRLRTALQVLAGPAWQLEVDDVQRVVCHSLRDGYQLPVSQLPPPVSSWSTPAPSAVSQPAIRRPRCRLIWGAASGVALAGILALGYTAFSLGISNLDERLARLESQGSTAATVETVAALQSDVTTLKTGLQDTRKKLGEMQQELSAAAKQAGSDDAVRQSLRTLQDAQQGLETRLSALTEQLTALKSQPAPAPAAPVAAPVKKNAPAAKKPRPADTRRAAPSLRVARNAPFVLTGVEKRGAESWAAIAPRGYSSLSQVALVGEGETVAGWTLVSAGYGEATFRVNGRLTVLRAE